MATRGKKGGGDGLTDRERAFALGRRADPVSPGHVIVKQAGFTGEPRRLTERARLLMKKPAVLAIIHAPDKGPARELTDDEIKKEMRVQLLAIVKSACSTSDKIKAIDKILATVPGGYVPLQVNTKGVLTLESLLRGMGGAPEEDQQPALPANREDA